MTASKKANGPPAASLGAADQMANRYVLAYRDMEDALRYLAAYLELEELQRNDGTSRYFDHCEAIMAAAVVAYCRPFKRSSSFGHADAKLSPSDLTCLASRPDWRVLHDLLETRRDQAIAHGDWIQHNTQLTRVEGTSVYRKVSSPSYAAGINAELFLELVTALKQELIGKSYAIDITNSTTAPKPK